MDSPWVISGVVTWSHHEWLVGWDHEITITLSQHSIHWEVWPNTGQQDGPPRWAGDHRGVRGDPWWVPSQQNKHASPGCFADGGLGESRLVPSLKGWFWSHIHTTQRPRRRSSEHLGCVNVGPEWAIEACMSFCTERPPGGGISQDESNPLSVVDRTDNCHVWTLTI